MAEQTKPLADLSEAKILTQPRQMGFILERLACEILDNHPDLQNTVLIGMQPRGIYFGEKLVERLQKRHSQKVPFGKLDVTFHRDDFRQRRDLRAAETDIPFVIDGQNVVLVDDVLYTGRTIRAGLDALLHFGRPARVELCCLVKRRFSREYPIDTDYVGLHVDALAGTRVHVRWAGQEGHDQEDGVWITAQQTTENAKLSL
jgi:pyrimidine operon attenuation protein/uracil phosphoribosyltransferase